MTKGINIAPTTLSIQNDRNVFGVVILLFFWAIGATIVIFREHLLPPSFSYDGKHIQDIAQGAVFVENNFNIVASFYKALGLENSPVYAGLLGYGVASAILLLALSATRNYLQDLKTIYLASSFLIFSAVYLGYYSKDVFALLIPLIILIVKDHKKGEWLIVLSLIVYAGGFRSYWWLILVFYLIMCIYFSLGKKTVTITRWFIFLVVLSAIATIGVYLQTGSADYFRTSVNEYRIGSDDATTMITPLIQGGGLIGGIISNALTAISLIMPFPMLSLGGIYPAIALAIASLWAGLFLTIKNTQYSQPLYSKRCFFLLVAMIAVQSVFEPDYGSTIRHLTPLLILVAFSEIRRSNQFSNNLSEHVNPTSVSTTRNNV